MDMKARDAFGCAPIAQLDRAADYGSAGWEFKSLWVHHFFCLPSPFFHDLCFILQKVIFPCKIE